YLRGGVPSERAVDLGGQIARVLAYAHAHGIAHGDLTPAAILIDRRAVVRVNNFGLPADTHYFATLADALEERDVADATLHATRRDSAPVDDVHALGLLLWQLLREQETGAFRDDVHTGLRDLVRRCVSHSHTQRITDAETLVLELEALARTLAAARP